MKRGNVSVYSNFTLGGEGGGGRIYASTLLYLTDISVDIV